MSFSLIVPAAAHKVIYEEQLPEIFHLNNKGVSLCVDAIMGLDLGIFSHVNFTILHQQDMLYGISAMLRIQLDRKD